MAVQNLEIIFHKSIFDSFIYVCGYKEIVLLIGRWPIQNKFLRD